MRAWSVLVLVGCCGDLLSVCAPSGSLHGCAEPVLQQHVGVVVVDLSVDLRIDRLFGLCEVLLVVESVFVHSDSEISDSVMEHPAASLVGLSSGVLGEFSVERESAFLSFNLEPHALHRRPSTKAT